MEKIIIITQNKSRRQQVYVKKNTKKEIYRHTEGRVEGAGEKKYHD